MANASKLIPATVKRVMSLQTIANTYANPFAIHHVEKENALDPMNANVMKVFTTRDLAKQTS